MKQLAAYMVIVLMFLGLDTKAQNSHEVLLKKIVLSRDSVSKAVLLETIEKQLGIHFSYNPELLEAQKRIKPSTTETTLGEIIEQLTANTQTEYKVLENQIVFSPLKTAPQQLQPQKYKTIKGKVITGKKEEPVQFTNIYILGKMVGTMANAEGKFAIKLPELYWADTLAFSCMGFEQVFIPMPEIVSDSLTIKLEPKTFQLKPITVLHYNVQRILDSIEGAMGSNYTQESVLLTTYYREIVKENNAYTNVSEAVLQVLKSGYRFSDDNTDDVVKFIKGRKSTELTPQNNIAFKLKGGPYYINKLDIVKNTESFINPENRYLYTFQYQRKLLIDGRETIVLSFKPLYSLRNVLFEGELFVDLKTWAIARAEFWFTRQGLKEARQLLVLKEPRNCKALPQELSYSVQYKMYNNKWHILSAQSSMRIKIIDKEQRQRTNFESVTELITTNIEENTTEHFNRSEVFKPKEVFTEKITEYDRTFWENYNTIQPEEKLIDAINGFDSQNIAPTQFQP